MLGPLRRAFRWPLCVKIIPEDKSPGIISQTSRERSAGLWMGSQKRGSPPGWLILTGLRRQTLWSAKTDTRDWLVIQAPTMAAWEGSRLKVVGMDALPTYKREVAWFPGPAEDTERLFLQLCRLNRGLDTGN
jgi:hypothetical protein